MDREVIGPFWLPQTSSIVEHIFRDSEFYAAAVARELVTTARSLATFSERGRVVPEYEDPTVRELIVRRYRLIYRVQPDRVEVLLIIHGARQMPPTL